MNNQEARNFVEAVYRDIWSEGEDISKISHYYDPHLVFIMHQPNGNEHQLNYHQLNEYAKNLKEKTAECETVFEEIMTNENKIIVKYRQRRVYKDGEVIYLRTVFEYELADGKIKRGWAFFNIPVDFNVSSAT